MSSNCSRFKTKHFSPGTARDYPREQSRRLEDDSQNSATRYIELGKGDQKLTRKPISTVERWLRGQPASI
jgi:hypothetical protein